MTKIGIDFSVKKSSGGAYQYCLTFLDALKNNYKNDELVIFNSSSDFPFDNYKDNFEILNTPEIESQKKSAFVVFKEMGYRFLLFFHLFFVVDLLLKFFYRKQLQIIINSGVSVMLFPSGSRYAPYINIPYLTTIYDLEHRKNPQFPELSKKGRWLSREHYFKSICQTATKILVDSEVGKEDVVNFYMVDPNNVVVLPYLAPNYLDDHISNDEAKKILQNFDLPEKFLFYPAQFWPHKNHINIVKAIHLLKNQGLLANIVFSGTKKEEWGEFKKVWNCVQTNGLERQVYYLGYVDNKVMSALYRLAVSLVMPTFLGPTNIPVLEAWKMHCPVLYSDIRGCREQLDNAGLLINPNSPEDISEKIKLVWENESLREDLVSKGIKKMSLWTFDNFQSKLKDIVDGFKK